MLIDHSMYVVAGGLDFCYDPDDADGGGGKEIKYYDGEYCDFNTCGECEGDCDDDSSCAGSLKCFQRDGNEPIPGCSGGDGSELRELSLSYIFVNVLPIVVHSLNIDSRNLLNRRQRLLLSTITCSCIDCSQPSPNRSWTKTGHPLTDSKNMRSSHFYVAHS